MSQEKPAGQQEEGIEVPYERLDPDTLRKLIQEFVTRDGADWGEAGCTLEDKVDQVLRQLRNRKVKIVFDLAAQTANIVACR
jgi:hypothetical protein